MANTRTTRDEKQGLKKRLSQRQGLTEEPGAEQHGVGGKAKEAS